MRVLGFHSWGLLSSALIVGWLCAPQLSSSTSREMMPLSPGVGGRPEAGVSLLVLTGGHRLCPSAEELAGPHAFLGGERMLQACGQSGGLCGDPDSWWGGRAVSPWIPLSVNILVSCGMEPPWTLTGLPGQVSPQDHKAWAQVLAFRAKSLLDHRLSFCFL